MIKTYPALHSIDSIRATLFSHSPPLTFRRSYSSTKVTSMANAPAWHEAYPAPRNTSPSVMERKDLLAHLQGDKRPGVDSVVVDLRKNDYEGGTIKGSINLPAQSLYPSLPTLLALWEAAGVKQVIWFCGSSQGRGTRAAGWLDDLINDRDVKGISSLILRGGIKGWVSAGDEYTTLMEGYDPHVWTSQK